MYDANNIAEIWSNNKNDGDLATATSTLSHSSNDRAFYVFDNNRIGHSVTISIIS